MRDLLERVHLLKVYCNYTTTEITVRCVYHPPLFLHSYCGSKKLFPTCFVLTKHRFSDSRELSRVKGMVMIY